MRAVCQRVSAARVSVGGVVRAEIGAGLVVLLGVAREDDRPTVERLGVKVARLRIFEDEHGEFDRSVIDVSGSALVVSPFTQIAEARKANRPSVAAASPPER